MKVTPLIALLALAACSNPMLTADMAISTEGMSVRPALSGDVGNATISVEAN